MSTSVAEKTTTKHDLEDQIRRLRQAIWASRPVLADIIAKRGDKNLYEYSLDFLEVKRPPLLEERREELFSVTSDLLTRRLGSDVATRVVHQLRSIPLISTTDHHGVLQHPFFVNANIISALPYAEHTDHALTTLVVFSFASISLNNASGYPRGLLFHSGVRGSDKLVRLPILPDKEKMGTVYASRAFTKEDIERANLDLERRRTNGDITAIRAQQARNVLNEVFASPEILNCKNLNEQCTKLTYKLWPCFFDTSRGATVPDLIYLEIETIVTELLQRYHLQNSGLISKVLFEPIFQQKLMQYFNNIPGAFSVEDGWGTFLFWGLDQKGRRVRLHLSNGYLCNNADERICKYTPAEVSAALATKQIYPSMMLCYLMVALYYGMKCLGGFCQVHDLTLMKSAWQSLLKDLGYQDEAEAVAPIQTKELSGDGMVLAYVQTSNGHAVPATGFDMMFGEEDTSFEKYKLLSREVNLNEIMQPMLPEMYSVLYPQEKRDPLLSGIQPEQILAASDLLQKLHL